VLCVVVSSCFLSCLALVSCLVLSCLVLSCLGVSCLVLSCLRCLILFVLCCVLLSHLVCCLVLSCLVLSCLVLSCLVLSCLRCLILFVLCCVLLSRLVFVLSCLVLSCLVALPYLVCAVVCVVVSFCFLSCLVLSCLVLSCLDSSSFFASFCLLLRCPFFLSHVFCLEKDAMAMARRLILHFDVNKVPFSSPCIALSCLVFCLSICLFLVSLFHFLRKASTSFEKSVAFIAFVCLLYRFLFSFLSLSSFCSCLSLVWSCFFFLVITIDPSRSSLIVDNSHEVREMRLYAIL
jgi:hypothetical protein